MQKSPTSQPAAALDNPQLDLPLFAEPGSTSSSPSPPRLPGSHVPAQPPAAPLAPDGSKLRSLTIGSRTLHYVLKRSARRTIGFAIDSTGLTITAPRWVTLADIESAIIEKQRWIFKKLIEWQTRVEQRALPKVDWKDGARSAVSRAAGERDARRAARHAGVQRTTMRRCNCRCRCRPIRQQIKDRVQGWLQGEAKRLFGERLAIYADKLGVELSCVRAFFRGYALGQLFQRRQDPPELAADPLSGVDHRLCGRA